MNTLPGWFSDTTANRIKHTYLNGFLDVSGSAVFRGDVDIGGDLDVSSGFVTYNKVGIGTDNPSGQLEIYEPVGSAPTSTTGSLVLTHGNSISGTNSIVFPSAKDPERDYAYISYRENYYWESEGENSRLYIGVAADGNNSSNGDNICLLPRGAVGVNTNNPDRGGFRINGSLSYTLNSASEAIWIGYYGRGTRSNRPIGLYASGHIACYQMHVTSDRRTKKNISEVPDNLSLQIIRDLPVKYYNHIDTFIKGTKQVIGFIAQEVYELLPEAVHIMSDCIPNEYRVLEDFTWEETTDNKFKLRCDLQDCSGITYLFKVTNNIKIPPIDITVTGNEDNSFTFEKKYTHIFLYGKEVDDFMSLDETQIYAVGISALQEIDREQQTDDARIATLETDTATLKTQMADALARLTALESK